MTQNREGKVGNDEVGVREKLKLESSGADGQPSGADGQPAFNN